MAGRDVEAGRAYVLIEARDRSKAALQKIQQGLSTLRRHVPMLKRLSRVLGSITMKLRQIGLGLQRMGRSFMGGGAALAGIFTSLVFPIFQGIRAAKEFRNEMNAVNAILELSNKHIVVIENLIRRFGRSTSYTATQIAAAGQELARGGFSPKELRNSLEAVLALGRAGKVDLTTASKAMIRSIRAFGMAAKDSYDVAGQLFQASREGTATVEELAMSLSFSAGSANRMNLSLAETLGILSKMANQMLHGTKGGTSFNRMLLGLATRSKDVAKNLGVDVFTPGGEPRGIVDIFGELAKRMRELSTKKQLAIMRNLFNIRGMRAAAAALNNFEGIVAAIRRIEKSSGAARKAQEEMNKGIVGSVNKLMSALNELAISFGDIFTKPLKAAEKHLIPLINKLSDWVNKNREIGWQLVKIVGSIGAAAAAFTTLGLVLNVIGATIASISVILSKLLVPLGAAAGIAYLLRDYFKGAFTFLETTGVDTVNRIVGLIKSGNIEDAFKISKVAIKKIWDVLILEMKLSWKQMIQDVTLGLIDLGIELRRVWQKEGRLGELLELDKKQGGGKPRPKDDPIYGWFKKLFGGGVFESEMRRGEAEWQEMNAAVSGALASFFKTVHRVGTGQEHGGGPLYKYFKEEQKRRMEMAAKEYGRAADVNKKMTDKREKDDEKRNKLEGKLDKEISKLNEELEALKNQTGKEIDALLSFAELKTAIPKAFSQLTEAVTGVKGAAGKIPFGDIGKTLFKTFTDRRPEWLKKTTDVLKAGIMTPKVEIAAGIFNKIRGGIGPALDAAKDFLKSGATPATVPEAPTPTGPRFVRGAYGVGAFAANTASGWQRAQQNRQDNMSVSKNTFRTAVNTDLMKERLGEIKNLIEEGGLGGGVEGVGG